MEEKVIGLEWIQESGKGEGEENLNVALQRGWSSSRTGPGNAVDFF